MKLLASLTILGLVMAQSVTAQTNYTKDPESCTSIMVGKKATTDGSVITSHTCDSWYRTWVNMVPAESYERDTVMNIYDGRMHTEFVADQTNVKIKGQIPQARKTYAFMDTSYPCINEKQLGIGETTVSGRRDLENPKGMFMIEELQRVALQRCTTAREAIRLMGDLVKQYGYGDSGECLTIADPNDNGFELCKLIKPQHPDTIVIFLTANDQESDQIRGYEVGAVDYITKPFVIGALQRKIKAMFAMLEHHKPAKDIYDDGRLFLDFSEQTASLNGKPLTLSPMEYKMLNLFRKNPRQVLTRGQLLEKLWDIDERFVDEHTLTTSISRIRSKIESDGGAPYIKTVYGMGYQWTGGEAK